MTPASPYLSLVLACYDEAEHLRASFVHGFKHLPSRFKLKPAA